MRLRHFPLDVQALLMETVALVELVRDEVDACWVAPTRPAEAEGAQDPNASPWGRPPVLTERTEGSIIHLWLRVAAQPGTGGIRSEVRLASRLFRLLALEGRRPLAVARSSLAPGPVGRGGRRRLLA
jgi:hypothetical protein